MADNPKNAAKASSRRTTRQRMAILEEVKKVRTHPKAGDIYQMVRRRIPDISFGTVYRNLKLLRELGEIMELNYGNGFRRFDGNPEDHYHISCTRCGRIDDIDMSLDKSLNRVASEKSNYVVHTHRLEFRGLCSRCLRK
jgi:Fe2+ or Zn2+ uptake regulation protein